MAGTLRQFDLTIVDIVTSNEWVRAFLFDLAATSGKELESRDKMCLMLLRKKGPLSIDLSLSINELGESNVWRWYEYTQGSAHRCLRGLLFRPA